MSACGRWCGRTVAVLGGLALGAVAPSQVHAQGPALQQPAAATLRPIAIGPDFLVVSAPVLTVRSPAAGARLTTTQPLTVEADVTIPSGTVRQANVRVSTGVAGSPAGDFFGARVTCLDCADGGPGRHFHIGPATGSTLPVGRYTVSVEVSRERGTPGLTERREITVGQPARNANLFVRGLEVTQGIQSERLVSPVATADAPTDASLSANAVPIVTGKATVARVGVGLDRSGLPAAAVSGRLRGFGPRGQELPGSPLVPVAPLSLTPQSSRVNVVELFQGPTLDFLLPDSWVAAGLLRLEATVNGAALPEAERTDECATCVDGANAAKLTLQVRRGPRLRIRPFRLLYRKNGRGPIQTPAATVDEFLAPIRRFFPISGIDVDGDREFSSDSSDCGDILFGLGVAGLTSAGPGAGIPLGMLPDAPELCGVRGNPFDPSDDLQFAGFSGFQGAIARAGGITAAHEVGHQLGLQHASCLHGEADGGTCEADFPQPHGWTGGIGYDTAALQVVDLGDPRQTGGFHAHDLMSYGSPRWISTTNTARLLTRIAEQFASRRAAVRAAAPQPRLVVQAAIDGIRGTARLAPVVELSAPASADDPQGRFEVALLDAAGTVLRRVRVSAPPTAVHAAGDVGTVLVALDDDPAAAAVVLREAATGDELARRPRSATAPTVSWTDPAKAAPLPATGRRTVSWTAADRDGDALTYVLQYRRTASGPWTTLEPSLKGLSFALDVARLPSAAAGRLRVVATDGTRTALDVSDRALRVPNHRPAVAVLRPVLRVVARGGTLPAEVRVRDVDGPVAASRIRWTVDRRPAGVGTRVALRARGLRRGAHTVTVTARDAAGAAERASFILQVR